MASHIKEYLDYYKKCVSPGYAVLVTGEWGVGKTFQIKQALKDNEYYYVSLFGLSKTEDIHSSVLTEVLLSKAQTELSKVQTNNDNELNWQNILPEKYSRIGKQAIQLLSTSKLPSGMTDIMLGNLVEIDRVVIFDDLERSDISLKDLLGVINSYVEHRNCRVIVIAHDGNLADGFALQKEKLFGQTIRVTPQIEEAFAKFSADFGSQNTRKFLDSHKSKIIGIFKTSGTMSLRILKHVIEDLVRLHRTLDQIYLEHKQAMKELVALHTAINIEVRTAGLCEDDLKQRKDRMWAYGLKMAGNIESEDEPPKLYIANDKYPTVELESNLLSDDALVQMFIEGLYDKELICRSLNNDAYFIKPEDAPPWKIVSGFNKLEDDLVNKAVERMDKQFNNREVTCSGEMLHIFGLRLMMAKEGLISDDLATTTEACKKYIDDLLEDGRLPARETQHDWTSWFDRAHDGYGFWHEESQEFKDISKHLITCRKNALEKELPEHARQLLEIMQSDAQKFFEEVCYTNNGENSWAIIPILAHINAEDFVNAWLNSSKENWRWIKYGLDQRYGSNQLEKDLQAEKEWALQVLDLLEDKSRNQEGFRSLRIKRAIPANLAKLRHDNID